jgi:hypothetical protein
MTTNDHAPTRPTDHLAGVADQIADALLARTLPKSRWTHEGHLLACISLVRRHGPADALAILRGAIPPYNESTGVANTTAGGYHDTITVYYVWAVNRLLVEGRDAPAILGHSLVERDALFEFWDRETLMSPSARAAWMEPTKGPDGEERPKEHLQRELIAR